MTPSCHQCGAQLPVAATRTAATRCSACNRGLSRPRSEHSVLFSLADLAPASGALPIASPQRRMASRGGEGSGLIDMRAMQSPPGTRATTAPSQLLTPMPTLMPAPMIEHAAPASTSQRPLYGLVATLMFTLASLTAFVLSEPPPSPPPSPRHTIAAPVLVAAVLPEASPEPTASEPSAQTPEPSAELPEPTPRRKPNKRAATTPTIDPPAPIPTPSKPAASTDDDTMKCLLGTGACKLERPTHDPGPVVAEPVTTSSLPERLSDTDITAGTAPVKASATTRCAPLAKGDERVRIKLSIAGPTGTVIRASAEDDGGNPALATCCASELERATFKHVQRPQMGALVTIKF